MKNVQQLKTKLFKLVECDKNLELFGSKSHLYEVNPCLTEARICAFELRYKITFPDDYRQFLLEVGNGGAGPGYGLFPLEEELLENSISDDGEYIGISEPFVLSSTANSDVKEVVPDGKLPQGTIAIATYGCGIDALLVVTGEQRGNIWIDDRSNDGGIYPFSDDCAAFYHDDPDALATVVDSTPALSFYDWYNDWLDRSLSQLYWRSVG